jgi:hypothetical protein
MTGFCCTSTCIHSIIASVGVGVTNVSVRCRWAEQMHVHEKTSRQLMQMHVHLTDKSESSRCGRYGTPGSHGRLPPSSLEGHW